MVKLKKGWADGALPGPSNAVWDRSGQLAPAAESRITRAGGHHRLDRGDDGRLWWRLGADGRGDGYRRDIVSMAELGCFRFCG